MRQLSRLLLSTWRQSLAQQHCPTVQPSHISHAGSAIASGSGSSSSGLLCNTCSHAWRLQTTAAGESKSMLGSTSMRSALESAAEARMNRIRAENFNQPPEQKSLARRALGFIGDGILLALLGSSVAAGYYTWRYETKDLETMVQNTKEYEADSFIGSSLWVPAMEKYLEARKSVEAKIKEYSDPTYHKLLPDMQPELQGRLKTLVLDLDDTLVSKEWTRKKGWTIYKRPGVQDFILELSQFYELVIFTDEPNGYADPIINRLDPHRVIPYRLYRPETQYHQGKHVRDLSKLNRDLSQVLLISANPDAWEFQPENTIKLKAWKNDPSDTTLLDLLPMLQLIALKGVRDVRDVVKSYDGEEDVAKAFKARMQQVAGTQKQGKGRGFLSMAK